MTLRLKPGSLTADGQVVGIYPVRNWRQEPVVVPADYGVSIRRTRARCDALLAAGWVMCPAALMPKIPERNEAVLIHRDSDRYRVWDRLTPERKRSGAGR